MDANKIHESRKRVADAYANFDPDDLIIRDLLALDRTVLGNERTFLSYIRTSLMFAASGLTLIKLLSESQFFVAIGFLLLPCSFFALGYGYWRFQRTRRALFRLNEKPASV